MDEKTTAQSTGLIKHLKNTLTSRAFMNRHRQNEKAFSRERTLTFVVIIVFLPNRLKQSLQDELDEFYKTNNGEEFASRKVSKSAFSQARKKLKHQAFIELNQEQVGYFYEHYEAKKWHGYRLLAIDGSMADLLLILAIGSQRQGGNVPKHGSRNYSMCSTKPLWMP